MNNDTNEKIGLLFKRISENRVYVVALISAYLWGIFAHGMMIFNEVSFHDDLGNLVGFGVSFGSYTVGRWTIELLEFFLGKLFGGNVYSLPPFNALVGFFLIASSSYIICKMLRINKLIYIIIVTGLLVVFPTMTSMIGYPFTLIYLNLAYLLVVTSANIFFEWHNRWAILVGAIINAFAIGIYQATIPFLLTMLVVAFSVYITNGELSDKEMVKKAGSCILFLILSLGLYIFGMKLSLYLHEAELSSYQGIDGSLQSGIGDYLRRIPQAYKFFFMPRPDVYPLNTKIVYFITVSIIVVLSVIDFLRMKNSRTVLDRVMITFLVILFPLSMNFIYVMCDPDKTGIYSNMEYANVFVFIFLIAKSDNGNYRPSKLNNIAEKTIAIVMMLVTVFYLRFSNICYVKTQFLFSSSVSYFTELKTRIESCEGYKSDMPVTFINEFQQAGFDCYDEGEFDEVIIAPYGGRGMFNSYIQRAFLYRWLGYLPEYYYPEDEDEFVKTHSLADMPKYPNDGSIRVVDDRIVVNF